MFFEEALAHVKPKEINLGDYNINLYSIFIDAVQGGGKKTASVSGIGLFEEIAKTPNCVLLADYLGRGVLRLAPTTILQYEDGDVAYVALNTSLSANGYVHTASVGLATNNIRDTTNVIVLVDSTAV